MDRKVGDQRRADLAEEEETILARMYSTPDSILLIDPEGMVLAASEAALQQFKLSAKEIMGQSLFRLLPANLGRLWRERVSQAMRNGQPVRFDEDRQGLAIENSVYPLCDEHGAVTRLVLVSCDITERKRAEEKLSSSEAFLNRVIERSSESLWVSDSEGTMIRMNQACRELFGVTDEEVVGKYNLLKDNLIEEQGFMPLVEDVFKKGEIARFTIDYDLPRVEHVKVRGATYRILDVVISPIKDANGKVINVIVQHKDITERKRAEQALRESERRFRDTIKNLDEGYYCCTPEGLLLEHNVAFNQILGFDSEQDLKGEKLPDFWQNPEDRKQYLQELTSQGFVRNYLINAKKIDGEQIVVMASAHLVKDEKDRMARIEGAFTDFTEQKRMEEELTRARDDLERRVSERTKELQEAISYNRNLIEASVDPLVTIGPEGKITDVNQATETITGRTRQELVGTDFSDYFTDPEKARAGYRQVFAQGIVRDYELLLRHADGHTTPVHYNATVYHDSLGQVVGVFAAARDVTERKSAEEKLVKSKQLLDETGRLARVGGWEIDLRNNEMSWSDVVYQIHELDPACHPTVETAINFYAPEAIPVISEAVRRAMEEGEPYDVELQLITAKGNRLWVRANGEAYRSNGEIVKVGGVFQDINDRKLAEIELKRHRDHLEELVAERTVELTKSRELLLEAEQVARLGSWEWDVVRDEITGSAEFYRLFDAGPEQIAHLPQFLGLLHADDRERVQRDLEDALEQRKMFDTDYRVILSDDEWRTINARGRMFFDEKGKPLRMVGTCMNITERKQAEEAILREKEFSDTVIDSIPGAFYLIDEKGQFVRFNKNMSKVTGYSSEELLRFKATDIIAEEDRELVAGKIGAVFKKGYENVEAHLLTKDMRKIPYYFTGIPAVIADKTYLVGMGIDIAERKRTEDALAESEKKLRALFETMSEGIVYEDHDGKIIFANPAAERLLGLSLDQMQGRTSIDPRWKAIHEDGSPFPGETHSLRVAAMTGKPGHDEVQGIYNPQSGDYVWLNINSTPEFLPGKKEPFRAFAVFRDITERRRVEEALRESEVKYRELFENAQVGMYRSKLDGSALLAVNSKLCEIFGYSEEEMLGNPATIRWADPQARDRMVTELRQAGSLRDYAMDIVRKGGEIRNCSVSVQLNTEKGYLEGSAVDVTERKQAVEAVRESAVRYHTLFNNSTDGILIVDIGAKTFKYANPALCRMFGYTEDELRTMGLPDIHPKETVQSVIAEFEALDRGDKALAPGIPCLRKDGSVFHADIGAVKITVDGMPCNLGFFRDITERKRVEEELARSNAELEQFAYVASHDLQEPLRMVSSYVQLLARHNQGKLDSDSQEFIAFATDGADRMQSLIQDLLTFSRVGTQGKPFVPTDCEAVLERALNHLKVAIEETGARITSDPLPLLRADDSQLVQLFQNLVGNALKFHRPGVPPVIHIGAERCGPDWVFAVRDNGIGIPAEQTQRVFEIFQRLQGRSQYAGTGIGLAICRKIVERHGGRIWVESSVGEGSTFTFTLPQGDGNRIPSPDQPSK